jgi:hypothetical protein
MLHRSLLPVAILALALAGCATGFDVSTSADPLTRFPASATFAWDPGKISLPDDPRLQDLGLRSLIQEVAAAEFGARGYRQVSGASNYRLGYRLDVRTWTGPDRSTAVATLAFQLAESRSGRLVWSGFARAELLVGNTPEERRARLHRVMAAMLADFPPAQRG